MSISIGISTDITSFSFSALDYTEYIQLNVKIDNEPTQKYWTHFWVGSWF